MSNDQTPINLAPSNAPLNSAVPGVPVPVLAATQERLTWRAVASWLQTIAATGGMIVVFMFQNQELVKQFIPEKYAGGLAALFAIGKLIEAIQHQKDVSRDKPMVDLGNGGTEPGTDGNG